MYITRIELENIRCFEQRTIQISKHGGSLLIAGDNGDGKSTVLQCIAMGLCDESSATALFKEIPTKFVRRGPGKRGTIALSLASLSGKERYRIRTTFTSYRTIETVRQVVYKRDQSKRYRKIKPDDFPWDRIFVTGYGAGARTLGSASLERYQTLDAVYTLFRYDEPLQNPELAIRRLRDYAEKDRRTDKQASRQNANKVVSQFLDLLSEALNLSPGSVRLLPDGIFVTGHWGEHPLSSVGDGYKSTVTMVMDVIAKRLLFRRTLDPTRMSGIVLVDEIEQHLHPRWQQTIMDRLTTVLPRLQFIATTHSPLVISGARGVPVLVLGHEGDYPPKTAYGWRAEDVYRDIMDLPSAYPEEITRDIQDLRQLQLNMLQGKLKPKDKQRLRHLYSRLRKQLHGSDPQLVVNQLEDLSQFIKNK